MAAPIGVGKEILAFCSSCRMDLLHTVAAMMGDRVVRVECRTCRKVHAHRPPKGITTPIPKDQPIPGSRSREGGAARGERIRMSAADAWNEMMDAAKSKPVKTYAASVSFKPGDRIKHPNFGEGVVEKLLYPNKIEIFFQAGPKVLVHRP